MDLVYIRFEVCGTHLWEVAVPQQEIIICLQKSSGETWRCSITDPEYCRDNPSFRTEIEAELKKHIYPVEGYFEIWIEGRDGVRIGHESKEAPGSFQYITTSIRRKSPEGNEMIWMGDRCSITHRITLNPTTPYSFEIRANQWPPAVFYLGNNRMIGNALYALDEQSVKSFTKQITEGAKNLGARIAWFITNARAPMETGF